MSKDQKLILRLLSRPKNFTYNELCRVLNSFGYEESQKGKTSGSRVAFIDKSTRHIIRLHKPHPGNELKQYQIELVIEELKSRGLV
ncbi:type II toxin-antitoxin system HicA family toxin [Chlorobium sp. KB01]|uniref:type II toxin-antitoxin system HicA family toxin n=1 Tax=Chlorobium sp. KB01 TaxID=1917528 RepID=UPI0009782154|nr:type II toxin-antitoxin system HicA family toxin [Chlorobium sp. KB01]